MRFALMRIFIFIILLTGSLFLSPHFVNAEEIHYETLKNGLRVVIVKNDLAPVITTEVNYLVGSNECPDTFPGMAHAQEHMMFRGSCGLSAQQLAALTAAMGGMSNADTQQTVTQYFLTVPAENLELALHIEAIRMKDVLDSEILWEKERGAIEQEVARDLSNPMYVFYSKLLAGLFEKTPYAHDALGTRSSFDKTTGAMLKKFHNTWYAPNNAILVIVGDVNPDKTMVTVRRLFEEIPSRLLPARKPVHLKPLKASTIRLDTDLPYGLAVVAYRLPGYESPDFAAGQILVDILDSRRANLYRLVTDGKALFAGFDENAFFETGLGFSLAAFPKGANAESLVASLKNIIEEYLKNGIPKDLVEASKRHEIADAQFRKNSIEGLADEWSQALAVERRNSPDDVVQAIRKVTVADVNRVARKYLVNKTAIVGLLIPRTSGKPATLETTRGRESFTPKTTRSVVLPQWAKKLLSHLAIPTTRVHPVVTTMQNGLKLIIQPENISSTVSISGRVKNNPDLEAPKGQEGVADILDQLFSYGTKSLNRLEFQREVDDIAAYLKAGTNFSLQVLSKNFDRGTKLLADNLLHPALPESAFKVVQQETMGNLKGELHSPSYLSRRALISRLYPKKDPDLREATPQTVSSLSLQDVKAYYKKAFRPDLTTIVVIGDVNVKEAKATLEKYFGYWKAVGPKPETVLPPVPLNTSAAAVIPDATRVQDKVTLAETIAITRSHPDYYPLELGLHVLSGGFYATRLYHDLREKAGLVYTVEAFLKARKTRSVFGVVYGCDPPNVFKARSIIIHNLRKMQMTAVTPEELEQARSLLIRQTTISESSLNSIAETLLDLSLEELPLDEPIHGAKRYMSITAPEIQSAFAQWIRPDNLVQITLGPEPK